MKAINARNVGIDSGSMMLFSDFQDGGPMWTGTGERSVRRDVRFACAFARPPAVILGISLWDMDHRSNLRADLTAEAITTTGFQIVFRTWGDSRIARIRANWTAMGSLPDEDDWNL